MPLPKTLTSALLALCLVSHAEDRLSLNGDWKFTTIQGDGSDYTDLSLQDGDIVIDNDHPEHVTVTGKWQTKTVGDRGSFHYGKDFLGRFFQNGEDKDNHVRYAAAVPEAGYYEHFVNYAFGLHLTTQINIEHAGGRFTKHISQRVREHQWVSLGIFKVDPAEDHFIEMTAITPGGVAADAVMYRPISEEQINKSASARAAAARPGLDDSNWDTLTVPGHWGMLNKYSNYSGKGWYRKQFTVPENWSADESERVYLKFDGVYHVARVFLNGKEIGSHRGGFTPFEFDVTDHLNFDDPNLVAVESDNDYIVGATWNWGGIIRDVELVKNKDLRITYQSIHAEPDLEKGDAALSVKVRIENSADSERSVTLDSQVTRNEPGESLTETKPPVIATLSGTLTVPANTISEIELAGSLQKTDVHLWHFDTPELYSLSTTARVGDSTLHSRDDRFGIRKIEVTANQFFLNGEPVRLAGFNRVSDHRYWGSSEPAEVINRDVDLMKEAGANMMRIMHGTQNRKLIERCDEKGILLIEEINVRDLTNPEFSAPDYDLPKQWLREMIERDINSPSIIGWSTGNELSDHFDYVRTTINYVKTELDPHRLVSCVSNTGYRNGDSPENDPLGFSDIILQNCYMQRPDSMFEPIRKRWPDKAIFFSEFGLGRFDQPGLDQTIKGLENWHESFKGRNPYIVGASLWTFNDYRSNYLATLPSENRAWGLVNAWRQKRRLFDQVRTLHSPVKFAEISAIIPKKKSAKVTLHLRGPEDYPSYTLHDYELVWSFRDINAQVLFKDSLDLPTLAPSIGHWSGEITWGDLPDDVHDFTIDLVTPNGYSRFDRVIPFSQPDNPVITTIVPGDRAVRVIYDKIPSATEYSIRYLDEHKVMTQTQPTIDDHIDVTGLINGHSYQFELLAWNDKGYRVGNKQVAATPNGKDLPPIIWDASISDGKLVVGYDGRVDDGDYELRYGSSPAKLTESLVDNVRGMMTVNLEGATSASFKLRLKNKNGWSNWSQVVTAEKPFEIALGSVERKSRFEQDGISVWGGSLIKGDDGLYHMFYSRWPKDKGWAWLTHSEIAHAVSETPFGPFKFKDVALADRGADFWDGLTTHNPTIHKFDGKYYLYYMGTTGDKVEQSTPGKIVLNPVHRNKQRIGVAVADSPNGPWKRFDQPLIDVSPDPQAPDALMVSNPSITKRPEGGYLMVYKAVGKKKPGIWGGPVVHCVATSDSPIGPFKKYDRLVFEAKGADFPAEDPFIWYQDGKYRAIVKDMHGAFTDAGQALVNFESDDGFDWKLAPKPLLSTLQIRWSDGETQKLSHLERPQLYLENGIPVALLCAADTKDEDGVLHSFNVQIPIEK